MSLDAVLFDTLEVCQEYIPLCPHMTSVCPALGSTNLCA